MTDDPAASDAPTATYRLQLRREFGFAAAAEVVPYLARLGVSHVYCSPVLEAVPGSAHGYDVVDHSRLSGDLGGDAGWARLVEACREHGLGIVVDVVPNHMALPTPASGNSAFWDVLRNGRDSQSARWFDVDWEMNDGQVLMPVLGASLEDCLAAGEIAVDPGNGVVRYFDHAFPIAPGTEHLTDDVPALLAAQHYRLAHWRAASTDLNYRRFFDVTSLLGVRVEDRAVFDATHARVLELVRTGEVSGLRIDHPDGLADPRGYLDRLADSTGGVWTVVEKILEHGEELPRHWRCSGTTGYDAIAAITHLLVDPAGERPLTGIYADLTQDADDFSATVASSKRFVVDTLFGSEVERLLRDLDRLSAASSDAPRIDRASARSAIVELLVAFDVYRAYPDDAASAARIEAAAQRATEQAPDAADAIRCIALLLHREATTPEADAFAVRFEQTTGPVMAKGVEDTAFYRYLRLTALNEVGGDPGRWGSSVREWHDYCTRLARDWPATMTTLTTHDTKRSEDVRARLLVLAELPVEWAAAVAGWRRAAERHEPPDAATDYLFWQTLVGAWPLTVERMQAYLAKATHEAKRQTSWIDPDDDYDEALHRYTERVFADAALMSAVGDWVATHVLGPGRSNALAQKLLQLTMPGVPDVYQGQELEEPSLVDPDNRRPVDYDARRARLARLADDGAADGAADAGAAKLLVTARTLQLRRDRPASFASSYTPVEIHGAAAEHAVAFGRGDDIVAVATRLPVGLARRGGWADTRLDLPPGDWVDVFTGRPAGTNLGELTSTLPVALLTRPGGRGPA